MGSEQPTVCGGPWPNSNVGDGQAISYEVSRGIRGESLVHGAIEAACFVDVALQRVWIVAKRRHCVSTQVSDRFLPLPSSQHS